MKVDVKNSTKQLSKKEELVLQRSNFEKISDLIKKHNRCTIKNPTMAALITCSKKDGGTFDQYVIHGYCDEEGREGWFSTGSASAGENAIELINTMNSEEPEEYALRIEYRQSKQDSSRHYYNCYII